MIFCCWWLGAVSYCGKYFRITLQLLPCTLKLSKEGLQLWWLSRMLWMCQKVTPRTRPATLWKPSFVATSNLLLTYQRSSRCKTEPNPSIGSESYEYSQRWRGSRAAMNEDSVGDRLALDVLTISLLYGISTLSCCFVTCDIHLSKP